MSDLDLITPDWPAPAWARAVSTTRTGGVSRGPYASLNVGDHVGDDPGAVAANRQALVSHLGLAAEPLWLNQVHGCQVVDAACANAGQGADAALALGPGAVCAVMTADCLPLLLCDPEGRAVAAVHAGWRGLAAGVIEHAVESLGAPAGRVLAWLGPAIGPTAFEVGDAVRTVFVDQDGGAAAAFTAAPEDGKWLADLFSLARRRLERLGLVRIYGGQHCTYSDPQRFFSYRRDGVTGRQVTLIWIES